MAENEFKEALPAAGGETYDLPALRAALVARATYHLKPAEAPDDFVALDTDTGELPQAIGWQEKFYWLDPDDTTTASDPDFATVFRTADDYCYKLETFRVTENWVKSRSLVEPPASDVVLGDQYIAAVGATAEWAGLQDHIVRYTRRGWLAMAPRLGLWMQVEDEDSSFVRYTADGEWVAGPGQRTFEDNSIPLSAIINAGRFVIVENQTLDAPPGARITGATASMPLGGTAGNVNDNNSATESTTSALGNLTAASVADRRVASLDLGAVVDIIAVRAKAVRLSTSTSAAYIYYSVDGATYTKLGADGALTTDAQDILRTGAVSARYVALVAEAINYVARTMTLADLLVYTDDVDASPGSAWIIAANGVGVLSGQEGKVAICELEDTLTIYAPPAGMRAFDKSLEQDYQFIDNAWLSATGRLSKVRRFYTASTTWTKPDRLAYVEVGVQGGGGGSNYNLGAGAAGSTASFGSHLQATGGGGGNGATPAAGTGGVGSGGDVNLTGSVGEAKAATTDILAPLYGRTAGPYGAKGNSVVLAGSSSKGATGGGGGFSSKIIDAAALASSETVTVGTAGANNGFVEVVEYIYA